MQSILKLGARGGFSKAKVLATIAIATLASAGVSKAALVSPGDTFDLSVIGDNATGSGAPGVFDPVNDVYLAPTTTYTFGTTQTVGAFTVTSGETVVGQVITDTITITDPTLFDAADLHPNGLPIITMVFDLGDYIEGTDTNGVNYSSSVNTSPVYFSTGGTMTYAAGTVPGPASTAFSVGNTAMSGGFAFQTLSASIPQDMAPPENVSSFSFTAVQVPEPASLGLLGLLTGAGLLRRRRIA